jgi:hypothetical protein
MSPQEDHIRNIQIQLLAANDRMKAALDVGDFRKAELAVDQLASLKRLLSTAQTEA